MAYSPTMLANNILMRSFSERRYISPMKLQKILYFTAAQYAKRTGSQLLAERFQTWAYGPVAYSAYDEFRPFAKKGIRRFARDAAGNALVVDEDADADLRDCLDEVWEATKRRSAIDLSELTHAEGSAWYKAYQDDRDVLDPDEVTADRTYLTCGAPRKEKLRPRAGRNPKRYPSSRERRTYASSPLPHQTAGPVRPGRRRYPSQQRRWRQEATSPRTWASTSPSNA